MNNVQGLFHKTKGFFLADLKLDGFDKTDKFDD